MSLNSTSEWQNSIDGKAKREIATVTYNGRAFTALGASVSPDYATGYIKGATLTTFEGAPLGTARCVATWRINSYLSSTMGQYECVIDGVTYTGRSCGETMLWRGRRKAK